MANRTKLTPQKKGKFLAQLRKAGNVSLAARSIGMARAYMYEVRGEDEALAAEWDDALQEYAEHLEAEADRRATQGVTARLYFDEAGNVIGETRRYSDVLLMFRLKGLKPDVYKERVAAEHSGPGGGPIEWQDLSDEDLHARLLKLQEEAGL